jgi:hypothetical protein
MKFEFVPTLEKLRDLYTVPRGPQRFQAYIDLTVGGAQRSIDLALPPLVHANPMAKENVLELVKTWIELGAEAAASTALEQAHTMLGRLLEPIAFPQAIKVGFTLQDDLGGGWTNRTFNDAARFKTAQSLHRTHWLSLILWSSETPTLERIRPLVLESVYRAAYATQHGDPQTLRQMMHQEGAAAHFAQRIPSFDPEELEYSRSVLAPHLEATAQPITFACMYGDDAARAIGYSPLGLSQNAGFDVALADTLEGQK